MHFGCQRDVPKSVGTISFSDDDRVTIFVNFDIVFCEESGAVVVAQLANVDKRTRFEAVENVGCFGLEREFFREWNDCSFRCFYVFTVGYLDAWS